MSSNLVGNVDAPNNFSREDLQHLIELKEINQQDIDTINTGYTELQARRNRINEND